MSESNNRPTRVFISTPCYGGLCLEKYMIGIVKLQLELIKTKYVKNVQFLYQL